MRRNLSGTNLLLNGIRKQRDESKPTGNPTGAPVKLSGLLLYAGILQIPFPAGSRQTAPPHFAADV
jgi:hypothetical protein